VEAYTFKNSMNFYNNIIALKIIYSFGGSGFELRTLLTLARQVLTPQPCPYVFFAFSYFLGRDLIFAWTSLGHDPPTFASQ
jgi:hypothetical protein